MISLDYRALALAVLGLAQMAGAVWGLTSLQGVAAATTASPAPKVFSSVKGLETFSTSFALAWEAPGGDGRTLALTPAIYPRLRGPYMRRNVYGAILAFGPVLVDDERTRPMFDQVARYAMCGDAPVLRELGIPADEIASNVRVEFEPRPGTELGDLPTAIEVPCP